MNNRIRIAFLLLVLTQALHSVEEYLGKLWEVYAPAKFLCSLVSPDPKTGFLIIDIVFILFGLWCWWFPVRGNYSFARGLILFWIIMESINVIGHITWALSKRAYAPGIITAPVIFVLVVYLARQLLFPGPGFARQKMNNKNNE